MEKHPNLKPVEFQRYYQNSLPPNFIIGKNIEFVKNESLCTMCGTCDAVCPEDAIKMVYNPKNGLIEPEVDESRCTECEWCVKVCPGFALDLENERPEQQSDLKINKHFGAYNGIFRAFSNHDEVRKGGASGGLATQICLYLLETKKVEGIIVTRMSKEAPLETETFIARNRQELLDAQKSKYCPAPVNSILKKVLRHQISEEKLAFVGLPAHVHGLRYLQRMFPELKQQIPYVISLFTSHVPSRHATEFLLWKNKVPVESLAKIEYRGHGHPGKLTLILKDGTEKNVPHTHWTYWGHTFIYYFYPVREWLYYDKMSEWADFSIGDNWQELGADHIGASTVITRSPKAQEIMKELAQTQTITSSQMTPEQLVFDQNLINKKNIGGRLVVWKFFGRTLPIYGKSFSARKREIPRTILFAIAVWLSERRVPFHIMQIYIYSYYLLKFPKRWFNKYGKETIKKIMVTLRLQKVLDWNYERKIRKGK